MADRLRKGLFSNRPTTKGLFGLTHGQKRPPADDGEPLRGENGAVQDRKVSYNAGWLNRRGEVIGQGDLTVEDAERIAAQLHPDELFIVMPAYWLAMHEDKNALPLSCVLRNGAWVIERRRIRRIRASHHDARSTEYFVAGKAFEVIEVAEVEALLTDHFEPEAVPALEETVPAFRTVYADATVMVA